MAENIRCVRWNSENSLKQGWDKKFSQKSSETISGVSKMAIISCLTGHTFVFLTSLNALKREKKFHLR